MNNPIGGGPMIHGNFTNKNTGETIFVKDCIDTGDGMILTTSIGQIPMKEFMNVYIQMSEEVYDENGNVIGTTEFPQQTKQEEQGNIVKADSLNIEFVDFTKFDDAPENSHNIEQLPLDNKSNTKQIKNESYLMVEKLFNKIQPDLNLKVTFDLDKFPKKEIITLVKYLDVNVEDIAKYLYDNYVQEEIIEILQDEVNSIVDSE